MIRARSIASPRRRPAGFTMVELLVVILILAVLAALLLPAINSALRSAKNSAVGAEINQLAQALASFKAKYGEYPPSRVWLAEDGNFGQASGNQIAPGDITYAQLAQRSLAAMRKFFPNVTFSTAVDVFPSNSVRWYDFNGDNNFAYHQPYILEGHECLVFFLGGIPLRDSSGFSATGFSKDPRNPFLNSIPLLNNGNTNPMYSNNRSAPLFEFAPNRLALDPLQVSRYGQGWNSPGYLDSLGNVAPTGNPGDAVNFYAYFSAYGNGGYDPNDVNFVEYDASGAGPTTPFPGIGVQFVVNFPVTGGCASPAPNPYTSSLTTGNRVSFINPQTFQIISSGVDGLYGVGGQYSADNSSGALPHDSSNPPSYSPPYNTSDPTIRTRERDNVTNFHSGRLD